MSFEIVQLKKEIFSGEKVEIPAFNPQEGFSTMSEIKVAALTKFTQNEKDYVGINTSIDGGQYYIVAKANLNNGATTFEIPEGQYAKFTSQEKERIAIDRFIGNSYGELSQSTTVSIAGTFNLEDFRESVFTLYIPIASK